MGKISMNAEIIFEIMNFAICTELEIYLDIQVK